MCGTRLHFGRMRAGTARSWYRWGRRKRQALSRSLRHQALRGMAARLPGPVIDRVKAALRAWFDGNLLGQDVLLVQIGQKIFAVDGVANYQIQGPVNDVTVGRGQLPVLGKLSVEELR